jgi:hypothetical protein
LCAGGGTKIGAMDERTSCRERPLSQLVETKAWQHLGLTGEEFRRHWYDGLYKLDGRDEVRALDQLMKTGRWELAGRTTREG